MCEGWTDDAVAEDGGSFVNLEDDRLSIEMARNLYKTMSEGQGPNMEMLTRIMGVAAADQHLAAVKEVKASIFPTPEVPHETWLEGESKDEALVYAIAGILRVAKGGHTCKHFVRGSRPIYVFLAPRVAACQQCLLRFYDVIAAHDAEVRAGLDMRCDFCLEEGVEFAEVRTAFGPCLVIGDMCGACGDRFELC